VGSHAHKWHLKNRRLWTAIVRVYGPRVGFSALGGQRLLSGASASWRASDLSYTRARACRGHERIGLLMRVDAVQALQRLRPDKRWPLMKK